MSQEPLIYALTAAGIVTICLITFYVKVKRPKPLRGRTAERPEGQPPKVVRSISHEEATKAKDELRLLDLEREILSDAIRKLYEAHAEGKITEEERERIAQTYKSRMAVVKEAISKNESLIALHELEMMREDLVKLFNERFDELNKKIEDLRVKLRIETVKEVPVPIPLTEGKGPIAEAAVKRRAQVKPSQKTEADRRVEEIKAKVERVLEKLEKVEIET